MPRINVYSYSRNEYDGTSREYVGHFDWDKAEHWTDEDYNGNGSGGTGRGEGLWRTAGGLWVLEHWTKWQNETNRYEYIEADAARIWLMCNDKEIALAEHFGDIPEEEDRRGGRPEIGGRINIMLGAELLPRADAYAAEHGISRAEAVRQLVEVGLADAKAGKQ